MSRPLAELIPTERQRAIFRFLSRVGPATTSQIQRRFNFPTKNAAYNNLWRLKQAEFLNGADYFSYETGIKEKYWFLASSGQAGIPPKAVEYVPELKDARKDNLYFRGIRPGLHDHEFRCVDLILKLELDLLKAQEYGYTAELVDVIGLNRFLISTKDKKGAWRNIYPDRVAVILFQNELRFLFFELDVNGNEALWVRDNIDALRGHFGRKIEIYSEFKKRMLGHPQIKKYLEWFADYKKSPFIGKVVFVTFFRGEKAQEKEELRLQRLKQYTEEKRKGAFFTFGSAAEILDGKNNLCFDPLWQTAGEKEKQSLFSLPK